MTTSSTPPIHYPRVAIEFCVQCKWNLRAAYFAQELLQTFSTSIGEISLIPVTGGVFTITLYHHEKPQSDSEAKTQSQTAAGSEDVIPLTEPSSEPPSITTSVIWDRKRDGGFPETKELKNRVRNIIEPGKDMGHVDRALRKGKEGGAGKPDVIAEGQGKANEIIGGGGNGPSEDPVSSEQPIKAEEKPASKVDAHAEHKHAKSPPDDCEECRDAMKNERSN